MSRGTPFWIALAVFQVAFGLAVFALTRSYYMDQSNRATSGQLPPNHPTTWSGQDGGSDLESLIKTVPGPYTTDDPAAISNQADELFAQRRYAQAAHLYQRLLDAGHGEASTYNNLGITLHYLDRSTEALAVLNEGVAADPSYQRIWLTLGFVNSQLGELEAARSALTTAVDMGADTEVGQSAANMLETIGPG